MLKQKNGKWVFVSRKTQRPLAYYRGEGKPSDEWVRKQEQRVQYFKHIGEETVINELFNSPYSVSLLTKTEDEVKYKFETKSKDLYVIVFERLTNFGKPANKWSISFKNKNKNSADDHDTTNTGDEIKVFSSVIDAMKKFVKDYDPQKLSFISTKTNTKGSGAENRSRLYERMLKSLASQNGFKYEVVNTDKTIAFKLTKIKKINESVDISEKGGLTIFDIDDTLFHTTAKVSVKKDGKVVRELNNQEYNDYKLKPGETFDYSQFRSAQKFKDESKPIERMLSKAKIILSKVQKKKDSKVIIVTARDDFDDKNTFLDTFRKYGLNIDQIRVERAGKIRGDILPAHKKVIIIRNYLNTGQFGRVRLFDDSVTNLKEFLKLQKEFPKIKFEAYFAKSDGSIKTINLNEAAYTGNVGFMELVKFHKKASQEQKKMLQSHIQNKKHKEFRDLIKQVTGVELHKTVNEKQEFVSKAGAGEWGRPELTRNYIKGTPGQNVKRFKKYISNI